MKICHCTLPYDQCCGATPPEEATKLEMYLYEKWKIAGQREKRINELEAQVHELEGEKGRILHDLSVEVCKVERLEKENYILKDHLPPFVGYKAAREIAALDKGD